MYMRIQKRKGEEKGRRRNYRTIDRLYTRKNKTLYTGDVSVFNHYDLAHYMYFIFNIDN